MATVSTAKEVRESNPEVAYEKQVFTEPFDIDTQALQVETAAKVGWKLTDAFLAFTIIKRGFGKLGTLHANAGVGFEALPVIVSLDHYISFIVSLLADAEGLDNEKVWAELKVYSAKIKALNVKYDSRVEDNIVQTSAASLAPQN